MARSLRSRLALALGLTAAISLAASAVLTFTLVRRFSADQAIRELRRTAQVLATEAGDEIVTDQVKFRALRRVLEVSGHLLATVGRFGAVRADTTEAKKVASSINVAPLQSGRSVEGFVDVGGTRYAYVAVPARPGPSGEGRLLSGVVVSKRAGVALAPILVRVLIGAGAAAALAALASTLLARRLARPVQNVAAATARVAAGDLDQRVPVEGHDELADLARSFNDMSSALAEARRREGEFLASVSHELRTPLTAIRGYVEALDDGTVRDAKGRQEALAVIKTEAARLERLVRDVMDLARLGTNEFRLEPRDADLAQVIREAASAHQGEAIAAGVSLDVDAPDALACRSDPDRVRQVITNLVENAVRVIPAGGSVRLAGRRTASGIEIDVADTGPGIPAEHLPHIFERSYLRNVSVRDGEREAATVPGLAPGSGLGLAIVRELVRALGGRVDVASEPGRGTTFRVTLPAAP